MTALSSTAAALRRLTYFLLLLVNFEHLMQGTSA